MKIIACEQGSDAWKAARLGIATASNFAAILARGKGNDEAVTRRDYRSRLVVERLTGKPVETFKSAAMEHGTETEPFARAAYESRAGVFVDQVGLVRHDELECGASPDGIIGDKGLLELKCPTLPTHLEYLRLAADTAPSKYLAQIQGQLWICERDWADFGSYCADFPERLRLVVRRIYRDDKYIAGLMLAVSLFMDEVRLEETAIRALPEAA